jgi:hypothetical protein
MSQDLKPQTHDRFHCEKCGMEIEVTKGCDCEKGCAEFRCCGQDMTPAGDNAAEAAPAGKKREIYQA